MSLPSTITIGYQTFAIQQINSIADCGYFVIVDFSAEHTPPYRIFTDSVAESVREQAAQHPRFEEQLLKATPQRTFRNQIEVIAQVRQAVDVNYDCHGAEVHTVLVSSENPVDGPESLYEPKREEWHYVSAKGELGEWLAAIPIETLLHIHGRLIGHARYDEQSLPYLTTAIFAHTIHIISE